MGEWTRWQRSSLTVGLVAHAQDYLWRPVVTCHHVGRHQQACGGRASQAKVQNLQRAIGLHNYVARLEVLQRDVNRIAATVHAGFVRTFLFTLSLSVIIFFIYIHNSLG